jgi:hypothetical protein
MTDKKNIWARSEQLLLLCGTNSPVCSAAEKNHKRSGPIVAKKTNTKASFLERKFFPVVHASGGIQSVPSIYASLLKGYLNNCYPPRQRPTHGPDIAWPRCHPP